MKGIRIFLGCLIWFVIQLPICIVLQKLSGIYVALAVYSYLLLIIFSIIILNTFDAWFKSKLK